MFKADGRCTARGRKGYGKGRSRAGQPTQTRDRSADLAVPASRAKIEGSTYADDSKRGLILRGGRPNGQGVEKKNYWDIFWGRLAGAESMRHMNYGDIGA